MGWGDFSGSDKPIVLELDVPDGIKGADLQRFDLPDDPQNEVLLHRGQTYQVKSIEAEDGNIVVKARLVPENELDSESGRLARAANEKQMETNKWGKVVQNNSIEQEKYARSIINDILDPEDDEPIKWPNCGKRMGRQKAKELRNYGKNKGIDVIGLADYDLPESSVKEVVDDAEKFLRNYPEINTGHPHLSITAEYMNGSKVFAATTNHLVTINANAYRNLEMLENEYQKLVKAHWFPEGTNHHALIAHEIGHVIHHHYPEIDPIEVAMRISGKKTVTRLREHISKELSEYASSYTDGREIISECYACVLTGVYNDFALKFVRECNKIIKKE